MYFVSEITQSKENTEPHPDTLLVLEFMTGERLFCGCKEIKFDSKN